ncbi:unnamed protein product [Gordionus sp. m RMFG-2023]
MSFWLFATTYAWNAFLIYIVNVLTNVFMKASTLLTCALTMDRYVALHKPLQYRKISVPRMVNFAVYISFLIPLLFMCPRVLQYKIEINGKILPALIERPKTTENSFNFSSFILNSRKRSSYNNFSFSLFSRRKNVLLKTPAKITPHRYIQAKNYNGLRKYIRETNEEEESLMVYKKFSPKNKSLVFSATPYAFNYSSHDKEWIHKPFYHFVNNQNFTSLQSYTTYQWLREISLTFAPLVILTILNLSIIRRYKLNMQKRASMINIKGPLTTELSVTQRPKDSLKKSIVNIFPLIKDKINAMKENDISIVNKSEFDNKSASIENPLTNIEYQENKSSIKRFNSPVSCIGKVKGKNGIRSKQILITINSEPSINDDFNKKLSDPNYTKLTKNVELNNHGSRCNGLAKKLGDTIDDDEISLQQLNEIPKIGSLNSQRAYLIDPANKYLKDNYNNDHIPEDRNLKTMVSAKFSDSKIMTTLNDSRNERARKHLKDEKRLTIMLLTIVSLHFICNIPQAIVTIIDTKYHAANINNDYDNKTQNSKNDRGQTLLNIALMSTNVLEALNFALNFYLYCIFIKDFRAQVKNLFCKMTSGRFCKKYFQNTPTTTIETSLKSYNQELSTYNKLDKFSIN